MPIDEKILNVIRGGFTSRSADDFDDDDLRQLRTAFFEGYQKRLGYAELGGCVPAYFVAELDDSSLGKLKQFELLSSATVEEYSSVTDTLLVPANSNEITCMPADHGVVLKAEIANDYLNPNLDGQDVYVYCCSQSPDQLRVFRHLAEGRWGNEADAPPSFGLGQSIYSRKQIGRLNRIQLEQPDVATKSLVESLFFHTSHPLSQSFIRVSKRALQSMSSDSGLAVSIGQQEQFEHLKLKLNCIPFWNQQIRYISGSDIKQDQANRSVFRIHHEIPYPTDLSTVNVRVLVCKDDARDNYYFSRDTIGNINPAIEHIFEVRHVNQNGRLTTTIKFHESCKLGPNDLTVVYAYNQASTRTPGTIKVGSYELNVLTSKILDAGNAPWQDIIHPEAQRFVTRADIRQSFMRFAPLALQRSLKKAERDSVKILTQLRKIPTRLQLEYGTSRIAVPTVVIELNIAFPPSVANAGLKQHYTALWEQRVEERCPAGTIVQIEWKGE